MTISGISNNVQALLEATNLFVTVLPGPPDSASEFAGYPAVMHYYEDTDNRVATQSQNRRAIDYIVTMYIIPDRTNPSHQILTSEVYPLIDQVIQMFDSSRDLSSVDLDLARACDFLRPAPGALLPVSINEGRGWQMTITLTCEADKFV